MAIVFSFSSCAIHSGLTGNLNNSTTNVVLQDNNYKIIQKVQGKASGMRVLYFGGAFKPLIAKARSEMLASANLIGKSRAIINETVEVNYKHFVVIGFKTVTVSAYVIEFTGGVVEKRDEAIIEKEDEVIIEKGDEPTLIKGDESIDARIMGKWVRKDGLEIIIDGNVGVTSQIKSGNRLRLLENDKINIGDSIFKDIIKTGELTWECKEFIRNGYFTWVTSRLTLNETGDKLMVIADWKKYTLSKVEE